MKQNLFLVSVCSDNNDILNGEIRASSYLQGVYSSKEKALDAVEHLKQQLITSPHMLRKKRTYGWTDKEFISEVSNSVKMVKLAKNKDYFTNNVRVALASFYYLE